jgi:predicted nucleic acid-binding protein
VIPYRTGDAELADGYEELLSGARGIDIVPIDRDVLRTAARLRANSSLRTPDAIQLASALRRACTAFVTCDLRLRAFTGMKVVTISA